MQLMTYSSRSSPRRSSAPKRRMKVLICQAHLTVTCVTCHCGHGIIVLAWHNMASLCQHGMAWHHCASMAWHGIIVLWACMNNVALKHVKAHCTSLEHHSLACFPRVHDIHALDTLLTCKWFDARVSVMVESTWCIARCCQCILTSLFYCTVLKKV